MTACQDKSIKGSGVEKTETREVSIFQSVNFSGIGHYDVQIGPKPSITIRADDNILGLIQTKVSDGELSVSLEKPVNHVTIHYMIQTPELDQISIWGALDARVVGLHGEALKVKTSGSSEIQLAGSVQALEITSSGSSTTDATGLAALKAKLNLSGSADVKVNATQTLNIDVHGNASISYLGSPEIKKEISGNATVKQIAQ